MNSSTDKHFGCRDAREAGDDESSATTTTVKSQELKSEDVDEEIDGVEYEFDDVEDVKSKARSEDADLEFNFKLGVGMTLGIFASPRAEAALWTDEPLQRGFKLGIDNKISEDGFDVEVKNGIAVVVVGMDLWVRFRLDHEIDVSADAKLELIAGRKGEVDEIGERINL